MVGAVQNIGHLMIARRVGGEPVELIRSPEEVVFLAFDNQIKRLVELHVLRSGTTLGSVAKRAAFERAREAIAIRGAAFMRILDVGEDQGLVYYTTNLNDGEFVRDYTARRGPFPPATGLCLVLHLLEELVHLQDHRWLVAHMRLDRVVVSTLEDTFLQLRVYDYGLSSTENSEHDDETDRRLVVQVCELIFLMLTGREADGENPDRFPALSGLPMDLRITIRTALTDPANAPTSLHRVREDVREAYGALVSSIQARNSRKQLVVTPALQPRSQLQDLLLENVPVETILGHRFSVEDAGAVRRYPFSIPCINAKNDQPVTVHLLPPSRIIEKTLYEAVPLQTWRFDAERHPNILRSLSVWESPDWTFLTEEREPGFNLSRLMAERIALNPAEVLVVLKQVQAAMDQALECGVQRIDLHPSNIVLRVGKAGPLLNREYERLMQKRLDAWPNFLVKLRAHLTMRNLYEPPLVDRPEEGEHLEAHLADRDYRHRAFVTLAAYLLTGERQSGAAPRFSESLPESLVSYMRETLILTRQIGRTPSPQDFLEQFETRMNGPAVPDLATRLRGATVAIEEMESAGSVSDFDNEWTCSGTESASDIDELAGPVARNLNVSHLNLHRKSRTVWPAWAAAAAVALSMAGWWQFSHRTANGKAHEIAAKAPAPEPPTVSSPEPTAAGTKSRDLAPPIRSSGAAVDTMVAVHAPIPGDGTPKMVPKAGAAEKSEPDDAKTPAPAVFASLQPPKPAAEWPESIAAGGDEHVDPVVAAAVRVVAQADRPQSNSASPAEPQMPSGTAPAVAEAPTGIAQDLPGQASSHDPASEQRQVVAEVSAATAPGATPHEVILKTAEVPSLENWKAGATVSTEMPAPSVRTLEASIPAPIVTLSTLPHQQESAPPPAPAHETAKPEPAAAPAVVAAPPMPEKAKRAEEISAPPQPGPAMAGAKDAAAPDGPVIIRRAIMPTAEEIAKFKVGKEKNSEASAGEEHDSGDSPKRHLSKN